MTISDIRQGIVARCLEYIQKYAYILNVTNIENADLRDQILLFFNFIHRLYTVLRRRICRYILCKNVKKRYLFLSISGINEN